MQQDLALVCLCLSACFTTHTVRGDACHDKFKHTGTVYDTADRGTLVTIEVLCTKNRIKDSYAPVSSTRLFRDLKPAGP